jgi:hypothetical protein
MTSDNSPSRSLARADTGTRPAALGPELEEAAGYARAEKAEACRLSAKTVAELAKCYAQRAGLKASDFSAHSLRSGFLTSAAARGASIFKMMDVSRHKTVETLRGYVRDAEIFRDHAGGGLL